MRSSGPSAVADPGGSNSHREVRILSVEGARVPRQCVVSRELVDPKSDLNRVTRMGNLLIFKYLIGAL